MSYLQRLLEIRLGRRLSVVVPSRTARSARQSGCVAASALLIIAAVAITVRAQNGTKDKAKPKSDISTLPEAAQERISAALGRDRAAYRTTAQTGGFRMENPRNGLSAEFTSSDVEFHAGANQWGMELKGYGHGDNMHAVDRVAPHAVANRVEYDRRGLTEWYENRPLGLEQGFTLTHRQGKANGEPLTLALALSGSLTATVDPGERSMTLRKSGAVALRYGGLMATDARGHKLLARLEVTANRLRLRIDDAGAEYPLTVDPLVQAAELTDGATNDRLGESVDTSSDGSTVVVGAAGVAYVFLRPSGGWASTSSFATQLIASSDAEAESAGFGTPVAISGDGNTIAVAATAGAANGAVLVFVKPASGWTSSSPLSETNILLGPTAFGTSVSLSADGNTLAVGSPNPDRPGFGQQQDEVEVFATTNGWISFASAQLTASDGIIDSQLGFSVEISGDGNTIVAGEPAVNQDQGVACVFVKSADGWVTATETAKLTASEGAAGDEMGWGVAISSDGTTISASAPRDNDTNGAVYVFLEPAGGWAPSPEVARLTASDGAVDDGLGHSLAMSGDGSTIATGAANTPFTDHFVGKAYVFARPAGGWATSTETKELNNVDNATGGFGTSIGLSAVDSLVVFRPPSLTIVVGASFTTEGAAFVFTGTALSSSLVLSLGNLGFDSAAGTTSSAQPITLTNSGTAPLGITSVAATGPFVTTQNCVAASPLAPGASCTEYVTFAASGVRTFTGTLTFTDDAGEIDGSTQQVALSGTGVQAGTSTTISSVSPNPAFVGQSVTISFSVAPPTGDTLAPSGTVTVSASTGESCMSTAPSGSCQITFTSVGTRTITASYGGDGSFLGSTSTGILEQVDDFTLSATSPITIGVGGSAASSVSVGSLGGFSSPVALSASAPLSGVSTSFSSVSVTPPSGSSASSTLTVSLEPFVTPTSFALNVTGISGPRMHSTAVNVVVIANSSSIQNVVRKLLGAGCISSSAVADALTAELSIIQVVINAGDKQAAIVLLDAIKLEIQLEAGRHIATSCAIGGVAFDPVTVLLADVQSLIGGL
jgi:trimeric autotransporter adhesin